MAAGNWKRYNKFALYIGDGTFDMDADTFKMTLHTSSYGAALTGAVYADLTNELSTANGYTNGGLTLTGVTWTEASGTVTFDVGDAVWNASGGAITARYAVIRKSGTANSHVDPLVALCLLDTTPADVSAPDGNPLTIQINAAGVFTLSGGQT